MQMTPFDYASALYLATKELEGKEAKDAIGRFIALMERRGIAGMLGAVMEALPDAVARQEGTIQVTVQSARELDTATRDAALTAIGVDKDTADVVSEIRPELVGGIRIVQGDRVYDATVRDRLRRMKNAVIGKRV